jgi:hypothetical protein
MLNQGRPGCAGSNPASTTQAVQFCSGGFGAERQPGKTGILKKHCMGNNVNLRESSKRNWSTPPVNSNGYPGDENLKLGCLLRIADASELMARNITSIMAERDRYKDFYEREHKFAISLRGQITKLKKQLAKHQ